MRYSTFDRLHLCPVRAATSALLLLLVMVLTVGLAGQQCLAGPSCGSRDQADAAGDKSYASTLLGSLANAEIDEIRQLFLRMDFETAEAKGRKLLDTAGDLLPAGPRARLWLLVGESLLWQAKWQAAREAFQEAERIPNSEPSLLREIADRLRECDFLITRSVGPLGIECSWARRSHPRLYFGNQGMAALREQAVDLWPAEGFLKEQSFQVGHWGGRVDTVTIPPRQPSYDANPEGWQLGEAYPYWTAICMAIAQRVEWLTLAYCVTGDEPYASKARQYLAGVSSWTTWTDPREGLIFSVSTSHLARAVSFAYDLLYDRLSTEERLRVHRALVRNALVPYAVRHPDPERDASNHYVVGMGLMGLAALALEGESRQASRLLYEAASYCQRHLDWRLATHQTEGFGYEQTALTPVSLFGYALRRRFGRGDLLSHAYWDELATRLLYFLSPDGRSLPQFDDAWRNPFCALPMRLVYGETGSWVAGCYLDRLGHAGALGLVYEYAIPATPLKGNSACKGLPSAYLSQTGWAALRSGWDDTDWLLAFKCSPSTMGHCHRDAGHFVLNVAGHWALDDPGYKNYSTAATLDYTTGTPGHNSLLVDGQGQRAVGGGRIVGFQSSDDYDYVVGDAAGAYLPGLLTDYRRYVISAKPDYVLVCDRVTAPQPRRFEWLFHPAVGGSVEIAQADDAASRLAFPGGASMRVLLPANAILEARTCPELERMGSFGAVRDREPAAQAVLVVLLTVRTGLSGALQAEAAAGPNAGEIKVRVLTDKWMDTWWLHDGKVHRIRKTSAEDHPAEP